MGTRGTWGFVLDSEEKLAYNHFDSYPGGLGCDLLTWLREQDYNILTNQVRALTLVDETTPPTPEQIEELNWLANTGVSSGQVDEWYVLLHDTQGNPELTLKAGYMEDGHEFPFDSLFCEWAYVIDLDMGVFEVYQGFQHEPHDKGRFANGEKTVGSDDYKPVALKASFDLMNLPTDEDFIAQTDPIDDED